MIVFDGHHHHHRVHREHHALRRLYSEFYFAVRHRHGKRAPGRDIRRFGVRTRKGVRTATNRELARSVRTFKRWLAPPPAPVVAGDRVSTVPQKAGGRWAIPSYIVMCESRGSYTAVNPSSGARGAYQLLASTYAAYGGDGSWSPADQDRVAARLYAAEGARPWECG